MRETVSKPKYIEENYGITIEKNCVWSLFEFRSHSNGYLYLSTIVK